MAIAVPSATSTAAAADALLAAVPAGGNVYLAGFGADPSQLADAVVRAAQAGRHFDVLSSLLLPGAMSLSAWPAGAGVLRLLYVPAGLEAAVNSGAVQPVTAPLSVAARWIEEGRLPVDVACIEVAPPDEQGRCYLGLSVDVTQHAVAAARHVIAEVNPRLPRVPGSGWVARDAIDATLAVDRTPPAADPGVPDDIDRRIAENVAALVDDGATIQLGVGSSMEAVADALAGHHDLGIFTGLFTDGLMRLIRAGAVSNRREQHHPGRSVTTAVIGSAELHRFVHDNDALRLEPVSVTHDQHRLAEIRAFTAINSAWEVALDGAVNAERRGHQVLGGVGGQLDFVVAAALAPAGRSIMALRSTARNGTVSRIVAELAAGTPVTTPRGLADWVVTEHGAVGLGGLDLEQRAEALISVAAPLHRRSLAAQWRAQGSAPTAAQHNTDNHDGGKDV